MSTRIRVSLVLILLMVAGLSATKLGPDAAGYTATDETAYSFVNIAGTGIRKLALTDDGTTIAPIGFTFELYGRHYTDVCISANGYLLFDGCSDAFLNQDLSGTSTPGNRPMIAPLWTDLTFLWPNADAVYYETLGAAPARQFVVQWNNAFPQNAPQAITMQVILHEGTNRIRFQYQRLDAGAGSTATNGGTATVGVCDTNGATTGRCLQWSHNSPVLRADTSILISPTVVEPPARMPGRIHGSGFVAQSDVRYEFQFEVREDAVGAERVTFQLHVRGRDDSGRPRNDRFVATTVTSVHFSDDPNVRPGPQDRSDTVVFNGTGEWNGQPNHTYEVSARDEGEPGGRRESIGLTIANASGAVVARARGELAGGNIQSTRIRH